jgi:hypothetical protein
MPEKIQSAIMAKYRLMCVQKNELEAYIEALRKSYPKEPEMSQNTTIEEDINEQLQDVGFNDIRLYMRSIEGIYDDFCKWLSYYRRGKISKKITYFFLKVRAKYQSIEQIFDEIIELYDCL